MNVNLAATYFGGQDPTGQINFHKQLAKTLIFNMHYNEDNNKTPDKKQKHQEYGYCLIMLPKSKNCFWGLTVNICTTNAIHAEKGMYLLPMLPRSLLVCRMFRLSSCLYRKQSFNTGLNSAAQKHKNWHANDHQ